MSMPTERGATPIATKRPLQNSCPWRFCLIILQRPPLSFGHFPRERGNPDSFAKVPTKGNATWRFPTMTPRYGSTPKTPLPIVGVEQPIVVGDLDLAIANYDTAVRLDPDDPFAYRFRGLVREDLGDSAEAENDFRRARDLWYDDLV